MEEHWKCYGRDYYCRYDYEDLNNEQAAKVKENLNKSLETFTKMKEGNEAKIFEYNDPVDHSNIKMEVELFLDLVVLQVQEPLFEFISKNM